MTLGKAFLCNQFHLQKLSPLHLGLLLYLNTVWAIHSLQQCISLSYVLHFMTSLKIQRNPLLNEFIELPLKDRWLASGKCKGTVCFLCLRCFLSETVGRLWTKRVGLVFGTEGVGWIGFWHQLGGLGWFFLRLYKSLLDPQALLTKPWWCCQGWLFVYNHIGRFGEVESCAHGTCWDSCTTCSTIV